MNLFFKHFSQHKVLLLVIVLFNTAGLLTADEETEFEYIQIEPIIVTNYQKKSSKKPGFVQVQAQLTVNGKESVKKLLAHMPLVRDFVIEFLSFTDEKIIKDVTKRKELRATLTAGIKAMLTKEVGEPLIEELIITHFMWD
ncbi:MAG: flagellar FliL protein [Enterobacterales bacterium]|jgi:flagellar FliL protein